MAMQLAAQQGPRLWLCWVACACLQCATEHPADSGGAGGLNAAPAPSRPANEPQEIGDFELEEADRTWAGVSDLYQDRLNELLFGGDDRRICQLVSVPSFEAESAVYILSLERGTPVVVSRRLDVQLWGLMTAQIEKRAGRGPHRKPVAIGPVELGALLAKIHGSSRTQSAEIDRGTAQVLSNACQAVLQRTRAQGPPAGLDGVTYHAANGEEGKRLSGRAWSPRRGTLTSDYVALGESLRTYAAGEPSQREAHKADLLTKAERLLARANGKP